jgi:hypothetical protein
MASDADEQALLENLWAVDDGTSGELQAGRVSRVMHARSAS